MLPNLWLHFHPQETIRVVLILGRNLVSVKAWSKTTIWVSGSRNAPPWLWYVWYGHYGQDGTVAAGRVT